MPSGRAIAPHSWPPPRSSPGRTRARFGIPVTFFSTGWHPDYHQLTDEVQYIDFAKMARVTALVADVARAVGDLDHRPVVDKPKPDPGGVCRQ